MLLCSTPFGICDEDIIAYASPGYRGLLVLNAFRHL